MIEAYDLCARLNYHKHKLVLVLSAMRNYRDFLNTIGKKVNYVPLSNSNKFMACLEDLLTNENISHLSWMETSDVSPQIKLINLCEKLSITYHIDPNEQFITSTASFDKWYGAQKKPLMETFYRWQRSRTGILMNGQKPEGGAWNYDSENRSPLPKTGINIPPIQLETPDQNTRDVIELVDRLFPLNPGDSKNFWLPTSFALSENWLQLFIATRLNMFGTYEDASKDGEAFLFHSVLSPLINVGLLAPMDVINAVLVAYKQGLAPLNSVEGFIRQILGWREYMHGMYQQSPSLMDANYFGFTKQLEAWWYDESYSQQPLPVPVKSVLKTLHTYGYNHHIERLMVLGNWFLLNEYDPKSVYTWFSSMYVDAYEWVMVPNVQGMSQYADGGIIATKPYISGGNYLQKMGSWWPSLDEAKKSEYNKLYWDFLVNHHDKLKNNFRMSIALKQAQKLNNK